MRVRTTSKALVTILLGVSLAIGAASADVVSPRIESPDRTPRSEVLVPREPFDSERPYWRRNFFKRLLTDQKYLAQSWARAELRRPALAFPLAASLLTSAGSSSGGPSVDLRLARSIHRFGEEHESAARTFSRLGDVEVAAVALGGSYLISRWVGGERSERATSLAAEALVNAGVYASLLKRATRRTRPSAGGSGDFFVDDPAAGQEATSFPSGHATGAFAVATVLAHEFRDKRWVPWVAYTTAGLIGASRTALGRHFPTDVVAGALVGSSMGRMVVRRSGGADRPTRLWSVEPTIEHDGRVGVAYRRVW